jgi:hypothetical protein
MDKTAFFASVRSGILGPTLTETEVSGCEAILGAMDGLPIAYCAYGLATAFHETNSQMQPVREAYWLSESWRKSHLSYYPYYGRGYVQLTHKTGYQNADSKLGLGGTLVANLDRALEFDIAAMVMRRGMIEGWFRGDSQGRHTFARHLPETGLGTIDQFTTARDIINGGRDKAKMIARHALQFQDALSAGGW